MSKIIDYSKEGVRRLTLFTGVIGAGAAANSEIFQFRWTSTVKRARIIGLEFTGAANDGTAAFAAGIARIEAIVARTFTAAGTGGTAATLTGTNTKSNGKQPGTLLGEARIATTAALGAGTKSLVAHGFGGLIGGVEAVAGSQIVPAGTLYKAGDNAGQAIVLAQNEGVIVRATVPATGPWVAGVTISWVELAD